MSKLTKEQIAAGTKVWNEILHVPPGYQPNDTMVKVMEALVPILQYAAPASDDIENVIAENFEKGRPPIKIKASASFREGETEKREVELSDRIHRVEAENARLTAQMEIALAEETAEEHEAWMKVPMGQDHADWLLKRRRDRVKPKPSLREKLRDFFMWEGERDLEIEVEAMMTLIESHAKESSHAE